jgi:hypothetical protein
LVSPAHSLQLITIRRESSIYFKTDFDGSHNTRRKFASQNTDFARRISDVTCPIVIVAVNPHPLHRR